MKQFKLIAPQCLRVVQENQYIYPVYEETGIREHLKERLQINEKDIDVRLGKVTTLFTKDKIFASKVHFLGLGNKNITKKQLKKTLLEVFQNITDDILIPLELFKEVLTDNELIEMIVDIFLIHQYRFDKITKQKTTLPTQTITLMADLSLQKHLDECVIIATAINEARHLSNLPSNLLTPTVFANEVATFAIDNHLPYYIYDKAQLEAMHCDALLAVSKGSSEQPRLISVKYYGDSNNTQLVALVGKGITFDTGGYSMKSAETMKGMKYDMCGGANMYATFKALVQLKAKVNLHLVIATSENMVAHNAMKVDDIINSLANISIEVTNTDAEGRLVLADAIYYAIQQKATHIIDMATLTGACAVALGKQYAGAFSNDDVFYQKFENSAKQKDELVWRLPLNEVFTEQVRSSIYADLNNAPTRLGGASIAASFLQEFVKDVPWIHLDVAGSATSDATTLYYQKGATGTLVKTLVELLK